MSARVVEARADAAGDDLLAALDLGAPRGTVVVNGTTGELGDDLAAGLAVVFGALAGRGLTFLTGGTDAGIFAVLGQAVDGDPLVGVVPRGLVTWPGGPTGAGRVRLEPHHTHVVLVDGDRWGDETPVLLELARALGRRAPAVVVVCGGGSVTRTETAGHLGDGRPVVVVEGSGRFADEVTGDVTRRPLAAVAPTVLAYLEGSSG